MPNFYSEHNLKEQFNAPQFTRVRHRFRGPRESEKINLEINQLYYSINKLYSIQNDFNDHFIKSANLLIEGGEISLMGEKYPSSDLYPGDETYTVGDPLVLLGLVELAAEIERLERRVKNLSA